MCTHRGFGLGRVGRGVGFGFGWGVGWVGSALGWWGWGWGGQTCVVEVGGFGVGRPRVYLVFAKI